MVDLIRLPADAVPPPAGARICIQPNLGGFSVEVCLEWPKPSVRFVGDCESFETALLRAHEFAQRFGTDAIYAIGCEGG
jgi:hypothetical protein